MQKQGKGTTIGKKEVGHVSYRLPHALLLFTGQHRPAGGHGPAARRAGLRELCTTDHCDLQDENGAPLGGWDWTPILDQYWRARDKGGSEVKVLLGLELGGGLYGPRAGLRLLVAAAPLVLSSAPSTI